MNIPLGDRECNENISLLVLPLDGAQTGHSNAPINVASPNGSASPIPSTPASPGSIRTLRKKSKSISNGALNLSRSREKRVSFDPSRPLSRTSFNIPYLGVTDTSANSSDTDNHLDMNDDQLRPSTLMNPQPLGALSSESMMTLSKREYLKNLTTSELERLVSERDQLMGSGQLPEFNKRPLTDTPVVSVMGSPSSTRGHLSGEDSDAEDLDSVIGRKLSEMVHSSSPVSSKTSQGILKTKNISHLSLADLGRAMLRSQEEAGSLNTLKREEVPAQNRIDHYDVKPAIKHGARFNIENEVSPCSTPGGKNLKDGQIPPRTSTDTPTAKPNMKVTTHKNDRAHPTATSPLASYSPSSSIMISLSEDEGAKQMEMDHETREKALKHVPLEVQREFVKTPSMERLKSLLMTKPPPDARKTYTLNIPGQTSSKTSPDGKIALVDVGSKLVIVMVGLPARGKSYLTNKLTRYLNWLQHDCRVFNVGNTRRKDTTNNKGPECEPLADIPTPLNRLSTSSPNLTAASGHQPKPHKSTTEHDADFFLPTNEASTKLRDKWAMDTLDQLLDYVIDGPGSVGIFDATNSTKHRRLRILNRIKQRSAGELKVLFLESICLDSAIIESNIHLKLSGPDYREMEPQDALADFVGRLHNYEKAYETIDDSEEAVPGLQYIKMINVGKKVVSYNIQGFLASQTVYFLLNFNLCERQIWITRHGESFDNLCGRIGGDSGLTKRGARFAKTLARFINFQRKQFRKEQLERFSSRLEVKSKLDPDMTATIDNIPSEPNFCVWTSMLIRAVETGQYFDESMYSLKEMRMLNELGGGKYEGLTYDEIQKKHPREFEARLRNKLTYRYPGVGGELYLDVLTRLRPFINEIERTTDHLLIISHRVVLRILLAYFLNLDKSSIGELDVPLHTLYCLELKPYGTEYRMYEYDRHLDWFIQVEPEHQKHVREMGVVFEERKYLVVPTAPPSSSDVVRSSQQNRRLSNAFRKPGSALHGSHALASTPKASVSSSVHPPPKLLSFSLRRSISLSGHVPSQYPSKDVDEDHKRSPRKQK